MNNNGQRLNNNLLCPRIDTSTPKSFYCSPKSYHYIPFVQRKYQSGNTKRQSGDKNCQNRLRDQISTQRDPCLFTKQDTCNNDSPVSSASFKVVFTDTNHTDRSIQSINNRRLQDQRQSREVLNLFHSKILSHTTSCVYENDDEEIIEKLDQFKNEILDDIIRRGVYTDSVIQDCIARNVAENSTLAMTKIQQAINELLRDIDVSSVELNKNAWITSSKLADEEMLNCENKDFECDEGESLSMVSSLMESNSDKLEKEDKSSVPN